MENNFEPVKPNFFERLWTAFKEFQLFKWFQQALDRLREFLQTRDEFFWFFVVFISLSALGIWLNSTWLICLVGLCWVLIGFGLFLLSIGTKKFFDEAALKEGLNPFWVLLFKLASNLTYTLGGIVIAITNILLEFHVNAANGNLNSFFQLQEVTWQTLIFGIGAPLVGFVMDMNGLAKQQKKGGKGVIALASLQLYLGVMTLFTGFLGGITAIKALSTLLSKPYLVLTLEFGGTSPSLSLDIYKSMGIISFVFFYFFIPIAIMAQSRAEIRNTLAGKETVLPKLTLLTLFYTSFLFLLIILMVGFYEGWVQALFYFIFWLLKAIWDFLVGLFQ